MNERFVTLLAILFVAGWYACEGAHYRKEPAASPSEGLDLRGADQSLEEEQPNKNSRDALPEKPNFIILFGDDMGYGDSNMDGHPTSRTPNLDQMAREGMRFTQFYSAAPVCSPSRASLMTGRYFPRAGVYQDPQNNKSTGMSVFGTMGSKGMLLSEITIPQALKPLGYVSGMVGKWHLGIQHPYHPVSRGFDSYLGCPFNLKGCNSTIVNGTERTPNCMVFSNYTITEQPADLLNIDARYVQNVKDFINNNTDNPFLFYFSSYHTHLPQFASSKYINTTRRGLFGDALAQFDGDVGEILSFLKEKGIANRTFVVFTADNGPQLASDLLGGEQGPLKCGKGTTYEGGVREPAIMWWPGVIKANTLSYAVASTLDIFPTVLSLAGGKNPENVTLDGYDLTELITGTNPQGPRDHMFYYSGKYLMAARLNQYKAHFYTMGSHCGEDYPDADCRGKTTLKVQDPPLLFDLARDPKERQPLPLKQFQAVLTVISDLVAEHNKTMTFGPPQIGIDVSKDNFPCCNPTCTPRPECCKCQ
ncbi:arylsulfatase A-like [Sycon ciliatum]|uniref:arylsulfatase A-like n=1 Tax=Sycon ciliatum TaxID=27933 RepID=UPI0031F61B4F